MKQRSTLRVASADTQFGAPHPRTGLVAILVLVASGTIVSASLSAQTESPAPGLRPDFRAETSREYQLDGIASWYGGKFQGRLTANGERFDTNQLTAAHRELPFGTIVRVTNTDNDRSVVVRINDRGPFVDNRVIDLSRAAADIIGMTGNGIAPVTLEILHYEPESNLRTLQIASFSSPSNADALVWRLSEAGLDPSIEVLSERNVHRVVIASVPETEVPALQSHLAELGYVNVLVRRE